MDFLDSLDLDVSNKRSRRVRSWYLYEQFKSLERNQLDATQKLKDRSYQDRVLRRELSERKARRNLYDQYGLCHSESRIERSVKSEGANTAFSVSNDDFYESFCELQNMRLNNVTDYLSEACSHDGKLYEDDFRSVDEHKDNTSCAESVNSVVNVKSEETVTGDLDKEIGEEHTVVDEINLYFDEVKDNLERIEKLTELDVDDKIFEFDSLYSIEENDAPPVVMKDKNVNTSCDNNLFAMWSKLVSFAYQIVQLNQGKIALRPRHTNCTVDGHFRSTYTKVQSWKCPSSACLGNCYVDYGSQFLTAVLACDVLRRGINRMCHILQHYVSPIKFATDDSDSSTDSHVSVKRKKRSRQNRSRYTCADRLHNTNFTKYQVTRKHHSENCWQHCSGSLGNRAIERKERRTSEPWRSIPKFSLNKGYPSVPTKSSYNSIWPDFSNDDSTEYFLRENCKCRYKVLNSMLKLSQYFDSVLKEIDDSMLV